MGPNPFLVTAVTAETPRTVSSMSSLLKSSCKSSDIMFWGPLMYGRVDLIKAHIPPDMTGSPRTPTATSCLSMCSRLPAKDPISEDYRPPAPEHQDPLSRGCPPCHARECLVDASSTSWSSPDLVCTLERHMSPPRAQRRRRTQRVGALSATAVLQLATGRQAVRPECCGRAARCAHAHGMRRQSGWFAQKPPAATRRSRTVGNGERSVAYSAAAETAQTSSTLAVRSHARLASDRIVLHDVVHQRRHGARAKKLEVPAARRLSIKFRSQCMSSIGRGIAGECGTTTRPSKVYIGVEQRSRHRRLRRCERTPFTRAMCCHSARCGSSDGASSYEVSGEVCDAVLGAPGACFAVFDAASRSHERESLGTEREVVACHG